MLNTTGQEQGGITDSWARESGEQSESQESSIKVMAWALIPTSHRLEEGQEERQTFWSEWNGKLTQFGVTLNMQKRQTPE